MLLNFCSFFRPSVFTHKKLKLLIIYELHKFTKKVAWSVQNECFFSSSLACGIHIRSSAWVLGNNRANRPKKEKKNYANEWPRVFALINYFSGTFLNVYGGVARILLFFHVPQKKFLKSHLGARRIFAGRYFGCLRMTRTILSLWRILLAKFALKVLKKYVSSNTDRIKFYLQSSQRPIF